MIEFGEDLLDIISENFTGAVAKPLKSISLSDRHAEATEFAPARSCPLEDDRESAGIVLELGIVVPQAAHFCRLYLRFYSGVDGLQTPALCLGRAWR